MGGIVKKFFNFLNTVLHQKAGILLGVNVFSNVRDIAGGRLV